MGLKFLMKMMKNLMKMMKKEDQLKLGYNLLMKAQERISLLGIMTTFIIASEITSLKITSLKKNQFLLIFKLVTM